MNPDDFEKLKQAYIAALDPLRTMLQNILDGAAIRTSESFRIAREGGPTLAVSTTSSATDVLPPGLYHITADTTGVFIAIGKAPTAIADGHDYRLVADGVFGPVEIREGERIAAIVASGTANLYYHRVR